MAARQGQVAERNQQIMKLRRHPATAYFILTFFISWSGAFELVAGKIS